MNISFRITLCAWIGLSLFPSVSRATLQVAPTRLELNGKTRSTEVALTHQGSKPATYRISVVFYDVDAAGKPKKIDDPGLEAGSIVSKIRFSPRRVTLQPDLKQVVRISLAPGEYMPRDYRAYLYFLTADDDQPIETDSKLNTGQSSFKLSARVAVSIPVVFKNDPTPSQIEIDSVKLEEKKIQVTLSKKGSAFEFGDLRILASDSETELAKWRGISLYHATSERQFALSDEQLKRLKGQSVRVEFQDAQELARRPMPTLAIRPAQF